MTAFSRHSRICLDFFTIQTNLHEHCENVCNIGWNSYSLGGFFRILQPSSLERSAKSKAISKVWLALWIVIAQQNIQGIIYQSYIVSVNPCYEIFREIFQSKGIIFQSCTVCERKRCNFSITHSLWILHNSAAFWHNSKSDNIGIEQRLLQVWSSVVH